MNSNTFRTLEFEAIRTLVLSHTGSGADTVLTSGAITAGMTYSTCVTAGAADGQTRTLTLMVTNAAGQTSSQPCSFVVAGAAGKTGQTVGGETGQTGQTIAGAIGQL